METSLELCSDTAQRRDFVLAERRPAPDLASARLELIAALKTVPHGPGRLFLLTGPPGSGKTKLADAVDDEARALGFQCAWGRALGSEPTPELWFFSQTLAQLVRALPPTALESLLSAHPALRAVLPAVDCPFSASAERRTPALVASFVGVLSCLHRVSAERPVLLVLDDLHAADRSSLSVLELLARHVRSVPLFVLGTLSERGTRDGPERAACVAEIAREGRMLALRARSATLPASTPHFSLELEGECWSLIWDGPPVRLKDTRGQRLLARLVSEPEREIRALDLASDGNPDHVGLDGGDAGELLDERARREYRARIETLRRELEEAEARADGVRATRLARELECLTSELARAFGMGGRARRCGSAHERARVAVQRRISDAIRRIELAAPPIGRHLRAAVRTGAYCVYRPGAPRSD